MLRRALPLGVGLLLLVLAPWLGGSHAAAQDAGERPGERIEGVLLDLTHGGPVPQGRVTLLDEEGTVLRVELSDAEGRFAFALPSPGAYRLEVERIGYLAAGIDLRVEADETGEIEIALTPEAMLLDPLVVMGDAAPRPPLCDPQLVSGRVIDYGSGNPLPGASVTLLTAEDEAIRTVSAGADGSFHHLTQGPGLYRLAARAEGYPEAVGGDLPVLWGDTIQVELRLTPSGEAQARDPMQVTGSARPWIDREAIGNRSAYFERMTDCLERRPDASRFAQFIDRSVIAQYEEDDWPVSWMLDREVRTARHATVDGGFALFGCSPSTYIDGEIVRFPGVLATLSPADIEAVEVHRFPRVPRRFWEFSTSPCGVLAIWTRRTPENTAPPPERDLRWVTLGLGAALLVLMGMK